MKHLTMQRLPNHKLFALARCWVLFHDGQKRVFYSFDKLSKRAKPNLALGMQRFEKMLMVTFKGRWVVTLVYENKKGGKLLAEYRDGKRVWV